MAAVMPARRATDRPAERPSVREELGVFWPLIIAGYVGLCLLSLWLSLGLVRIVAAIIREVVA